MLLKVTFRTDDMWVGYDLWVRKINCVFLAMCELKEESCSVKVFIPSQDPASVTILSLVT